MLWLSWLTVSLTMYQIPYKFIRDTSTTRSIDTSTSSTVVDTSTSITVVDTSNSITVVYTSTIITVVETLVTIIMYTLKCRSSCVPFLVF